jgi:CRISPR/Cas system-associated endoribonuclease Cas2
LTLISPTNEKASQLIGIYSNLDEELDDAFRFLKPALENNEVILLLIDESLDRSTVHNRMKEEWNISADGINALENKGDLIVERSSQWFQPSKGRRTLKRELIEHSWNKLVTKLSRNRKRAVRAFVSTSLFFRLGMKREFLEFEYLIPPKIDYPLFVVCAYQASDLLTYLTKEEIRTLCSCHSLLSISNRYNIIDNPPNNEHILLLYDNEDERDKLTAKYINEGLKHEQLCVYASVMNPDTRTLNDTLKSRIVDFDNNIKEGNLLLVNLSTHYLGALASDLEPFNIMERELTDRAKIRQDKHVRIVADCAGFLYENKHFDECVELEQWWHQKPFEGSYLCPFRNSLCDKFPYNHHKYRVFGNHDIIIDEHASLIGCYIPRASTSINSILHLSVT